MTSFFSPITDTGIPTARSDEAGVSFEMGKQMAMAWKEAHPDTPIVMVQLGWPNHTEVNSGRTAPFVRRRSVRRPGCRKPRCPGLECRTGGCKADHRRPVDPAA